VADEQHRPALRPGIGHAAQALALELGVADREHLVDDETSGSRCAATAKARRRYMPLEYRFTGVSRNCSVPAKSTISSKRRAVSARLMPRTAALR
jgi:hypothetical protein